MKIVRARKAHTAGFRGEEDTNDGAGGGIAAFDPALPSIDAGDEHLPTVTAAAWEALQAANERDPRLFLSGTLPVRIEHDAAERPFVARVTPDRLRYALARAATWFAIREGEVKRTLPPMHVVRDLLAAPVGLNSALPVLTRIVEVPVFGPDGNVKIAPGYDVESQTFFAPPRGFVLPPLPDPPNSEDMTEARRLLCDELLGDFPFLNSSDQAHALALLLVPFVRDLIAGPTPLHLIDKPSPGTGASLLTDVLCTIATGHPAAKTTEAGDEQEWRKRITALLLQGMPVIVIDNLRRRLDSAALSSAITSPLFGDRILGRSEAVRLPVRCAWAATANNAELSAEITRRTIRIRLDAGLERPWTRQVFRHLRLIEWVRDHHAQLVWAAIVLGRFWIAKGRPAGNRRIGMFESWAETIGGILDVADVRGFLGNIEELHAIADTETAALRRFIRNWWSSCQDKPVGAQQLYSLAEDLDLGEGNAQSRRTRLGYLLRSLRDRRFGKLRVALAGSLHNAQQWRLEPTSCSACGAASWRDPLDAASACIRCSGQVGQSESQEPKVIDKQSSFPQTNAMGKAHQAHQGSQLDSVEGASTEAAAPPSEPVVRYASIIPPGITIDDLDPKPEDGTLRKIKIIRDDRERDHALGETGGFLEGYTHTLNPAVGCVFACTWCGEYCYAQHETPARVIAHQLGLWWGEYLFVKQRIAEALKRDLARASERHPDHPHHVSKLKVFMSSLTEPCAGPALDITRQCLREFAAYPIARLVLQTRSPKVVQLLPELQALGDRVLVSFTVESDSDQIWQEVHPRMLPPLRERRKAVATLHASGVTISVTVSPCARLADPEEFAVWIAMNSSYAVVDTFVAGDGKGGTRTEKTDIPALFAARGWMWSDESAARGLYERVRTLIGDRVGWSKEGFNRLTTVPTGVR